MQLARFGTMLWVVLQLAAYMYVWFWYLVTTAWGDVPHEEVSSAACCSCHVNLFVICDCMVYLSFGLKLSLYACSLLASIWLTWCVLLTWLCITSNQLLWQLIGRTTKLWRPWQATMLYVELTIRRRFLGVPCLHVCNSLLMLHVANHQDMIISGTLKDNAEQIGLAIKHIGMRPSLPILTQAVSTFFHLALPRQYEVCRHMVALCMHDCVNGFVSMFLMLSWILIRKQLWLEETKVHESNFMQKPCRS